MLAGSSYDKEKKGESEEEKGQGEPDEEEDEKESDREFWSIKFNQMDKYRRRICCLQHKFSWENKFWIRKWRRRIWRWRNSMDPHTDIGRIKTSLEAPPEDAALD